MLTRITDHAARAVGRLVSQFYESTRLRGLVAALADEVQAVETALFDTLEAFRSITTATGDALDKIGALVGAPVRGPRNDAEYRARILTQIFVNRSSGSARDIYTIARALVPVWAVADQPKILDQPPGAYILAADPVGSIVNTEAEARELAQILNDANSAGVRGIVLSQGQAPAVSFSFDNGPGLGFGDGEFTGAYDGNQ